MFSKWNVYTNDTTNLWGLLNVVKQTDNLHFKTWEPNFCRKKYCYKGNLKIYSIFFYFPSLSFFSKRWVMKCVGCKMWLIYICQNMWFFLEWEKKSTATRPFQIWKVYAPVSPSLSFHQENWIRQAYFANQELDHDMNLIDVMCQNGSINLYLTR